MEGRSKMEAPKFLPGADFDNFGDAFCEMAHQAWLCKEMQDWAAREDVKEWAPAV